MSLNSRCDWKCSAEPRVLGVDIRVLSPSRSLKKHVSLREGKAVTARAGGGGVHILQRKSYLRVKVIPFVFLLTSCIPSALFLFFPA